MGYIRVVACCQIPEKRLWRGVWKSVRRLPHGRYTQSRQVSMETEAQIACLFTEMKQSPRAGAAVLLPSQIVVTPECHWHLLSITRNKLELPTGNRNLCARTEARKPPGWPIKTTYLVAVFQENVARTKHRERDNAIKIRTLLDRLI